MSAALSIERKNSEIDPSEDSRPKVAQAPPLTPLRPISGGAGGQVIGRHRRGRAGLPYPDAVDLEPAPGGIRLVSPIVLWISLLCDS